MKQKVYLAGPISGLTYDETQDWRDLVASALNSPNVECLTPMRGKDFLKSEKAIDAVTDVYDHPLTTFKGITRRDMFDTLRSTCLFVNLLGAKKASLGTVMELAWAYQNQIPTIVLMEKNNLHQHAMVIEACTYVVDSVDAGIAIAKFLLNEV